MNIERYWRPALTTKTHWMPHGHLRDLGLCDPPAIYENDSESVMAASAWVALYTERRQAFDLWYAREAALAEAAIAAIRERLVGHEPAAVFAARGAAHVAAFGWDGRGHAIERVEPEVGVTGRDGHDLSGASVLVSIGETFGGGDNWFGPLGHRTYRISVPVEGRSPWVRPDPDPGLDAMLARCAARREASRRRYDAARSRVVEVCEKIADDGDRWWTARSRRAKRIRAKLFAQIQEIDPLRHVYADASQHGWTDPKVEFDGVFGWAKNPPAPLDIWPGRGARPRRVLGHVNVSRGWYAVTSHLRAA